jgi:hypothetical protein
VVNARVYEGIHFRFADVQARKQGRHVARWTFSHFLRPLDDSDDGHDEDDDVDRLLHAALHINIPNYASAIATTNEVVDSISSLKTLGMSA